MLGVPGRELPVRAEFPLSAPWPRLGDPEKGHARRGWGGSRRGAWSALHQDSADPTCGGMWTVRRPARRRRPGVTPPPGVQQPGHHAVHRRYRECAPGPPSRPHAPLSGLHPGTPAPPSSCLPAPDPRIPAILPELLGHYLRLRLVPGRRDVPLQDAAGGREPLRHAGRSSAQPAPPRSLAEERPRGPPRPARGALPTGALPPPASSRPHLPASDLLSSPAPRASRSPAPVAFARRPRFPTPRPSRRSFPSPSLPRPLLLPSRLISSSRGRTSGSQIPPLSRLSAGSPFSPGFS